MAILPFPPAQISHPAWCACQHDQDADRTDPRHLSRPVRMRCSQDDYVVTVQLERWDDLGHGQRHGETGIAFTVTWLPAGDGDDAQMRAFLTFAEIDTLVERIQGLKATAETDVNEVVW